MWDENYVYTNRVDGVSVSQPVLLAISPAHIPKASQTFLSEGMYFYVFILRKQATEKNTSNDYNRFSPKSVA